MLQGSTLFIAYFTGKLVDGISAGLATKALVGIALALVAVRLIDSLLSAAVSICSVKYLEKSVERHLARSTLDSMSKLSIGQIINENSGFRQSVITKGETAIINIVDLFLTELIPTFSRALVTAAALVYVSPPICLITVVGCVLYFLSSFIINSKLKVYLKRYRKMDSDVDKEQSEIMRNMRLVMVNGQERRMIDEHDQRVSDFVELHKEVWIPYNIKVTLLREPIGHITMFAVLVACVYLHKNSVYTIGDIVKIISWVQMLWSTLGRIGPFQRRLTIWHTLANRYFEMLEVKPAVIVVKNALRPQRLQGSIEFRNVSFSYPRIKALDDEDEADEDAHLRAIHDVSFVIEPGETCALVGPSGSGKSTIVNLLLRAYDPDAGEILLNGIDLRLYDPVHLRKLIGYVEQDVKLWDQTLRYNILYGINGRRKEVTETELLSIADRAGISEFYDRLGESRFETLIGENGIKLSGGQKQRVGIARALAKEPSVLIFDEATNSLDTVNDHKIQQTIKSSLVNRTGIIIAHRLSTVRHADRIITLEKGRVVGVGRHNELVQTCSAYQSLVDHERIALSI